MTKFVTDEIKVKSFHHDQKTGYTISVIVQKDGKTARLTADRLQSNENGELILTAQTMHRPVIITQDLKPAGVSYITPGMCGKMLVSVKADNVYLEAIRA